MSQPDSARARRGALGLLVAVAVAGSVAGPARAAGTFTEYLGARPDGAAVPAGPWTGLNWGTTAGGAIGVQIPSGAGVGWSQTATLASPAGLAFAAAWVDRSFAIGAGGSNAQGQAVTTWERQGWPYTGVSEYGGYTGVWGNGGVSAASPSSLSIQMSCVSFGAGGGACGSAYWLANRIELTLSDATPPSGTLVDGGGPLLDGGWQTGATATLTLSAADVGGGVHRAFLRDGASTRYVALEPSDSSCRDARPGVGDDHEFAATTSLVPCPTAARDYAPSFSLAALGDGVHAGVEIGVEDAAGRETTLASDRTIRVNAPGGTLPDPGTPCPNGTHDASGTCVARPPTSTSAPRLSGSPVEGMTLVTDSGAWDDVAGVRWGYAWESCAPDGGGCLPVAGAAGAAVALDGSVVGRRVRSLVSATTSGGSTVGRSALSPVVEPQAVSAIGGAGVVTDVEASAPVAAAGGSAGGGGARRASRPAEGTDRVELPVPATRSGAVNGEGDDGSEVVLVATLGRGAAAHPGARATSAAPSSRIAYDVAPTIVGRITTAAGVPIAGAQIDVVSQATTAGAHGRIDGAARTDDDGRFTYRAAAGASRILTFGYRRTLADRAYARVVHVSVRAVPTITLSVDRVQLHNQATVSFTGRVLGEPAGSHRVVELQVLQRGRWTTFATTRLTGGAYRHRYRFTRTFRSTRYRFRARAAKDPTVALETTVSATRAIEVLR